MVYFVIFQTSTYNVPVDQYGEPETFLRLHQCFHQCLHIPFGGGVFRIIIPRSLRRTYGWWSMQTIQRLHIVARWGGWLICGAAACMIYIEKPFVLLRALSTFCSLRCLDRGIRLPRGNCSVAFTSDRGLVMPQAIEYAREQLPLSKGELGVRFFGCSFSPFSLVLRQEFL